MAVKTVKKKIIKKAKAKKGKRGPGKGLKVFFVLAGLLGMFLVTFVTFNAINKAITASKSVEVAVDMEIGSSGDGPGQFKEPWGVATDSDDNFYVTDFGGQRVKKFNPAGEQVMVFGEPGKEPGQFNQPSGLFIDAKGDIYVCDTFNHRVQKFDAEGNLLKAWSHSFFGPRSVTGDGKNRIYVVDTGNHRVQVFDPEGNFLMDWGGFGTGNGKFREPVGSTVDSEGFVYIADSDNERIQKFDPNGKFVSSFKVATWLGKNEESPYLAFSQGFLYASNASGGGGQKGGTVLKYDLSGKLIAICLRKEKGGFFQATGLAADHQNRFYVVERGPGKVARFTIPAVPAPTK